MDLLANPELVRNARAQLRPGRMLAAAVCTLVVTCVIVFALTNRALHGPFPIEDYRNCLQTLIYLLALALVLGGGGACLSSVHREKEMNTYDFQRVTRLTPLELALGKLFGAPATVWFIGVCFFPAIVWAAVGARARPTFVLAAVVLVALAAICVHAFCILISLLMPRGTNLGSAFLLLILFMPWFGAGGPGDLFALGSVNTGVGVDVALETSWHTQIISLLDGRINTENSMTDIFFGRPVHHVFTMLVLYPAFTLWFLLAIVRNIKRDPDLYSPYTPLQSLGFLFSFNFLLMGFYRWRTSGGWGFDSYMPLTAFLLWNAALLVILGSTQLRSREHVRRMLRGNAVAGTLWLNALWPAPLLIAGALVVGGAVIGMTATTRSMNAEWSAGISSYRVVFLALWLSRDFLYLQWMSLRRSKRALPVALLFLIVYYACVLILLVALGDHWIINVRLWSWFLPLPAFDLMPKEFLGHQSGWLVALLAQVIVAGVFVLLHRKRIQELAPPAAAEPQIPAATAPAA